MDSILERNKEIVKRFNYEFIEGRNIQVFEQTVDPLFINHTMQAGAANAGKEGVLQFIQWMWQVFPDLTVEIQMQIAEGDLVTTYKTFRGTHKAAYVGIEPTNKKVSFRTIDIIRIKDEKAIEHWSVRDNMSLYQQIAQNK
jgi:predicted ester cyclase